MQLAHVGLSSPHLILLLRQVKHPVFVLFLAFGFEAEAEPVGDTSPGPLPAAGLAEDMSMIERRVWEVVDLDKCQ
jgi:hypothetical protein